MRVAHSAYIGPVAAWAGKRARQCAKGTVILGTRIFKR